MKTYFITGATGAIGSALVPLLLADPDVEVRLLLRAPSPEALHDRLEHLFRFWEVPPEGEAIRRRVIGLRGDATLPRFGLTATEYGALTEECSHIVHAAGNVRMNLPIEEARRSSVDSAQGVVALARACINNHALRKLEFVSTVGVGGRMPLVPEAWISEPRGFHNTYEQAKAEAEDHLRRQMEEHGLPVTVHRPSMVVGDSRTGKIIHFQIFYYLCEFLSGRQTRGILPILSNTQLDTIPVDYVVQALHWSSTSDETVGKVLHLCSGREKAMAIPWLTDALRKIFDTHGQPTPPLRQIPLWLFGVALPVLKGLSDPRRRKALSNLSLFLDYASDRQEFDNRNTIAPLTAVGIRVPSPQAYLRNLLAAYFAAKRHAPSKR